MLKIIGLITLFVVLAKFPNQVKDGVDTASWFCKIVWIMGEGTFKFANKIYVKDIAPQVEAAKSVNISIPDHK